MRHGSAGIAAGAQSDRQLTLDVRVGFARGDRGPLVLAILLKTRQQLGRVVMDYADDRVDDDACHATAYQLALAGFELYGQLFLPKPEDQAHADNVQDWLKTLRDGDQVESLELIVDTPWSVP